MATCAVNIKRKRASCLLHCTQHYIVVFALCITFTALFLFIISSIVPVVLGLCFVLKMVTIVDLHGYEQFVKYAEAIDPKGPPVFLYFSGEKLPSGESWCIDCVEAEPVVKAFLSEIKKHIIFVYVDVGDRETWKDKACSFRTDNRLKLMVIPTIIRWKGVQRLEGSQCTKRELLQMLFDDED